MADRETSAPLRANPYEKRKRPPRSQRKHRRRVLAAQRRKEGLSVVMH